MEVTTNGMCYEIVFVGALLACAVYVNVSMTLAHSAYFQSKCYYISVKLCRGLQFSVFNCFIAHFHSGVTSTVRFRSEAGKITVETNDPSSASVVCNVLQAQHVKEVRTCIHNHENCTPSLNNLETAKWSCNLEIGTYFRVSKIAKHNYEIMHIPKLHKTYSQIGQNM